MNKWENEEFCHQMVRLDPTFLQNMKNPSVTVIMSALSKDGTAIKYLTNPTEDQIQKALYSNGLALEFISNKTFEHCLRAVNSNPAAVKFVNHEDFNNDQKLQIINAVINRDLAAISLVNFLTQEQSEQLIKKSPRAFMYLQNQTYKLSLSAVMGQASNIQYVEEQTPDMCLIAIASDAYSNLYKHIRICDNPDKQTTIANLLELSEKKSKMEKVKKKLEDL